MGKSGSTDRPSVVIVDDSDEVRLLVRTRLKVSGLFDVVAEGKDGLEAVALAYHHQPSLMLLDTSMPTMDGLEALPGILAVSPQTKVVVFTGFEERGLGDLARELGAADFVEKSHPIDQLAARLAQIVGATAAPSARRLRAVGQRHPPDSPDPGQAVLDEHQEHFRAVFDEAAIGMATLTLNGSIVRANRALAALVGSEPEDLVGVDYGRLTCGKGPELDRALESIQGRGRDLATFEHDLPGDDETRTARVTLAPVRDAGGSALYAFIQLQDISGQRAAEDELRQSEERFRLLISAVEEYAIFMLDPEGHVMSWNAGAQRIKGYPADEIIGQHFRVFYPAERQQVHHPEAVLRMALADGSYAEEGWRIRRDGSQFWASVVITAVFDEDHRHVGFAKVTRDQTERRLAEEQREQAVEQQTQLLAVTAHELRTPIAVIDGSVSTVMAHGDRLPPAERDALLANVRTSARRLQQLTSDLLTASRLDADSLRLRPATTSVGSVLTNAVQRAASALPGVHVAVDGDLEAELVVDAERIGQAVDNLILNAIRHGRPPIRVSGERAEGSSVVIRVSDSGPGVEEAVRPQLFERFASSRATGGTGLGLYIVREITQMHGGAVRYEPPEGPRPSQFVLTLPGPA